MYDIFVEWAKWNAKVRATVELKSMRLAIELSSDFSM